MLYIYSYSLYRFFFKFFSVLNLFIILLKWKKENENITNRIESNQIQKTNKPCKYMTPKNIHICNEYID